MNDSQSIFKYTNEIIERYKTRNPFTLAALLDIKIDYKPYSILKGHYLKVADRKYIIINPNLNYQEQLIVCAHELGHALLHDDSEAHSLMALSLSNMDADQKEREANRFAVSLLVKPEKINKEICDLTDNEIEKIVLLNIQKVG
ncbi:ImmA/IrrE family metallo-endopeptidase [Petroclostridium sp. X23]|uniref:ImmA/IrrE family metallo-endopeptidase n=1 Tax=Petroclostridium sp. X23 TaxID=3045146 RepID=UPI0024AD0B2F|nr:ImmA/IrrE family metallo-endopeptidase [Petroclostridium sp. X23]WHH58441.1 ImmA/IrrE family metallo-endopeptidase [Petroclostridium sp. X23]